MAHGYNWVLSAGVQVALKLNHQAFTQESQTISTGSTAKLKIIPRMGKFRVGITDRPLRGPLSMYNFQPRTQASFSEKNYHFL